MKVKIGNTVYDSKEEPILIILSDIDKANISNMLPTAKKYLSYPDDLTIEEAQEFMKIEEDEK